MERTEKVYRSSDIAKFCDVKNDTAQKWLVQGKIPSFKTPGGHFRVREPDFIAFLNSLRISVPGLTAAPRKPRVLIVEDDNVVRRFTRRLIESEFPKLEIHEAIDGYEAGFKTGVLKPDIVILDVLLPWLDGIRVCRMIRRDKNVKSTKILAISAYQPDRMKRVVLRAGANAFIEKPLNNEELIDAVGGLLGIKPRGTKELAKR